MLFILLLLLVRIRDIDAWSSGHSLEVLSRLSQDLTCLILPIKPLFLRTNIQVKLPFPYSFYLINTALPEHFYFATLFRIICLYFSF